MFTPSHSPLDPDAAIRSTDDDAAHARVSAVRKGYLDDTFIGALVPRAHLVPSRSPLINIGTYIRSVSVDHLVEEWIRMYSEHGPVQIISLGAGSDTRFWRMCSSHLGPHVSKYIELDFPEIVTKKCMAIRKNANLRLLLGEDVKIEKGGTVLRSEVYQLRSMDLRQDPAQNFSTLMDLLSPEAPTLVLSECVFPYLEPSTTAGILKWFSATFTELGLISYEIFGLGDNFGRVMRENLMTRKIELLGVQDESTCDSLKDKVKTAGFVNVRSASLEDIRKGYLSSKEKERILSSEKLDELEELSLILRHYAVLWADQSEVKRGELGGVWSWLAPPVL